MKVYDKERLINYLLKDSEKNEDRNIVVWDMDITRDTSRIFTDTDLDSRDRIKYWLSTANKKTVERIMQILPEAYKLKIAS